MYYNLPKEIEKTILNKFSDKEWKSKIRIKQKLTTFKLTFETSTKNIHVITCN